MKKKVFYLNIYAFIVLLFIGCSPDESNNSSNPNGGNVYRYQIVTIDVPGIALNDNQYPASFGSFSVTVMKTDENKLSFGIPIDAPLGDTELIIPSLNNTTVRYNVLQPELEQSSEETFASFISLADAHFLSLQEPSTNDGIAQNNYFQFKDYLANNATEDEKEKIALYYYVNKVAIDSILQFDVNNPTGRFDQTDILAIQAFCGAVLWTAGGGLGVVYFPEPSLKLVSTIVAGISFGGAIVLFDNLAQRKITVLGIKVDSFLGNNNRNAQNNTISLQDEVMSSLPLALASRELIDSDSNNTNSHIKRFFSSKSIYNNIINYVNEAIANLSSFISLSTFNSAILSQNSITTDENVTSEIMQDITFSITHPNLQLVNATLQSDGQLNVKVKIIGNPTSFPVVGNLNYTYNDGFSSFSGTFPVEVQQSLVGTWTMVSYDNGTPVGTDTFSYNENCLNIWDYKEAESGSFQFTENTFTYSWINNIVVSNINYNSTTCEIYSDSEDTSWVDSESGGGSYENSGGNIVLTYSGTSETNTVQFITSNRIKIFDQEFVRN